MEIFSGKIKIAISSGYKAFFMLNSAEHEIFCTNKYENANNIFSANKYENANNSWHFHIY